eukprot:TRINITY_DN1122_c0_g1_i2.p1 TRINITY_DN1122_c0_g1~~TRINITY_DN1122_c0_g1_i2.p1  ORF type:complete len:357 (-),score=115.27 TRINITY_DN1122_c0_g1_i2:18-1088(-)
MVSRAITITIICLLFIYPTIVICSRDYYDIVGVSRDATPKQIKKAFRSKSAKIHPDQSPESKDEYMELVNAYGVLNDADKRRIYDQYGEEGLKQGGGGGGGSPFDFFSGFGGFNFGGRQQQGQQMEKGDDVVIDLEVLLRDLYLGKVIEVAHKKQTICSKCRGTGAKKASDVTTCSGCKGSGVKVKVQQMGPGFVQHIQSTCDECGGKGKKVTSTCTHCHGHKVETGEDTHLISVERGMADGERIIFSGKADENPETLPGDVIFQIVTIPHKKFVRKGNDLHFPLSISLLEALNGHMVNILRSDVTKPGQILTVAGEGFPHRDDPSQKGILYVEISVKFPTSVSSAQKEGFAKLLS